MAQAKGSKNSSQSDVPVEQDQEEMGLSEERAQLGKLVTLIQDAAARENCELRKRLLTDAANLRGQDAVEWFWKRWKRLWPESPHDLLELRDELRELWLCDSTSALDISNLVDPDSLSSKDIVYLQEGRTHTLELPNKWLSWRPTKEQEEIRRSLYQEELRLRSGNTSVRSELGEILGEDPVEIAGRLSRQQWQDFATPFTCSLWSRQLLPEPRNLRAMLVQGVLEHWGHFKYCANSACLSPYFIASRRDQTVCDAGICKAERQREHARKWWNENRAKKAQDKEQSRTKTAKKESKRNVARKAR